MPARALNLIPALAAGFALAVIGWSHHIHAQTRSEPIMSTNRPTTVNVPQAPETEVLETIAAFNKAFAENDPETYFTFIDPAITLLLPSSPYRIEGVAMDREEFLYSLRKGTTQVQYFHQMQTIVQLYGTTAVVTYHSRGAYGPDGSVAYFKETDVLVKKEDGWKIVHIHLSSAR